MKQISIRDLQTNPGKYLKELPFEITKRNIVVGVVVAPGTDFPMKAEVIAPDDFLEDKDFGYCQFPHKVPIKAVGMFNCKCYEESKGVFEEEYQLCKWHSKSDMRLQGVLEIKEKDI